MKYELRKIIIDYRHPTIHDGSMDKMHTEIIVTGNEREIRQKLFEEGAIKEYHMEDLYKFKFIKKLARDNGYFVIQRGD